MKFFGCEELHREQLEETLLVVSIDPESSSRVKVVKLEAAEQISHLEWQTQQDGALSCYDTCDLLLVEWVRIRSQVVVQANRRLSRYISTSLTTKHAFVLAQSLCLLNRGVDVLPIFLAVIASLILPICC